MEDNFKELKAELLRRVEAVVGTGGSYILLNKSETLQELLNVVKEKFCLFCVLGLIDVSLIKKYEQGFADNNIYANQDVTDGYLLCDSGKFVAHGKTQVVALNKTTVVAFDEVVASMYNESSVWAHDHTEVWACGSTKITACGSATVRGLGSATVEAHDDATVEAEGWGKVIAYEHSLILAHNRVKIEAHDDVRVMTLDEATVCAHGNVKTLHLNESMVCIDKLEGEKGYHVQVIAPNGRSERVPVSQEDAQNAVVGKTSWMNLALNYIGVGNLIDTLGHTES